MPNKSVFVMLTLSLGLFAGGCDEIAPVMEKGFTQIPQPKSKLSWGLLDFSDGFDGQIAGDETPQVLWTHMRSHFELAHEAQHPRVKKYIKEYTKSDYFVKRLRENAAPFLYFITQEVEKRGLPFEIALLPMVESNFNPLAISKTGASGLWQIMPATGRILGLKQDYWYDGRVDVQSSTHAALSHLQYLHRTFKGDWLHAIAAYNCGERRVQKAIEKNRRANKPTDFWHLDLPRETKNYVPKLLAVAAIINEPNQYGIQLPTINNQPVVKVVELDHQLDIHVAAQVADLDIDLVKQLNPAYAQDITHPHGPHRLLLPLESVQGFEREIKRLPKENWHTFVHHQVKTGENLSQLAGLYKTQVSAICEANGLESERIQAGNILIIPASKAGEVKTVHVVAKGDSLWSISQQYQVKVDELKSWNQLGKKPIQPGQELMIMYA